MSEPPENPETKDTFVFRGKRKVPWWDDPIEYAKVTANPTSYKKKEEPKEGLDAFV